MIWRLLKVCGVVGLLAAGVLAAVLLWTHVQVQREHAPLPVIADLLADGTGDLPVRISVIETAHQAMPRAAVIEEDRDPHPGEPYVMTHPAFVLEWADGRILLVDVGMTREKAIDFGALIERFGKAKPIEPLVTTAGALGAAATRVRGIVFTHLHIDHVDGLVDLCPRIGHRVKVFMTRPQMDVSTFTTREGIATVREGSCVNMSLVAGKPLLPLEGFPGVGIIAAGGHTPGSQIVLARVRPPNGPVRRYLLAGDIANTIDGIRADVPKPLLYRLVMVPEDDDRLGELRRYLRTLEKDHDFTVVVSHDAGALKASGIPAWGSS